MSKKDVESKKDVVLSEEKVIPAVTVSAEVVEKVSAQIKNDPTLLLKTEAEILNSGRWSEAEKKVVLSFKSNK